MSARDAYEFINEQMAKSETGSVPEKFAFTVWDDRTAQEIWRILVDQQYSIGTVGQSPALMGVRLASRKLGNIPSRACIAQHCRTPGSSRPETWFYQS